MKIKVIHIVPNQDRYSLCYKPLQAALLHSLMTVGTKDVLKVKVKVKQLYYTVNCTMMVGGNRSTRRKPTQTQGEHAISVLRCS